MPPKRGRGRGRGQQDRRDQPQGRPGEEPQIQQERRDQPQGRPGEQRPQQPRGQQERRDHPQGRPAEQRPQQPRGKPFEEPHGRQQEQRPDPQQKSSVVIEELGLELKYKAAIVPALPRRPAVGRLGRPIKLISNCYSLELPSGNVYHYDVEILSKRQSTTTAAAKIPTEDKKYRCMSTKRNREIIEKMLTENPHFKRAKVLAAYDGRKNLFTRHPLSFVGNEFQVDVIMDDGIPAGEKGPRPDIFQVQIKPVRKRETNDCAISLDPLHALFQGKVTSVPQEAITAVETVLRHGPCLRYTPVGRNFFYPPDPQDVHPLGGGKEIWFGYHQSLRLGQWKPMVNLDMTATTFYRKGPVMEYVLETLSMRSEELRQRQLRDADIQRLTKELKNMRIEVTHLKSYRRKYRILKFTRESANRLYFKDNERQTSVADYFKQKYNRQLNYPNLPCIQVNPETKKVYLPIEVCEMIEGQHCKKKLEDRQNAEMIKFTARPPGRRFGEIDTIRRRANFEYDRHLQEFGIRVAPKPLSLEGRVLDAPNVLYKLNDGTDKVKPRDGSWDMRGRQYYRPAEIGNWVLLSFGNPRFCDSQKLNNFASLLCSIAREQGISVQRPATIETVDKRRQSVESILCTMQKKYNAALAVVVVPGNDKSIYGEVKQAAETCLGLVTQCIKDDNVVKKCNPPLVSNLCQKINAKMGGVNNALLPGETPPIMRRPVIIIGADVTHPSPSQDIKPSIAAAVGSLDAHPSRYAVTIRAQTNVDEKKQSIEIILELKSMIVDLLRAFHRNTRGKKPEKIIFYRDGVSEGQFDKVREHEVQCIREACKSLDPEYKPGITFIVVQKRHHTRFMPQNEREGSGKMRNIPPGTTVDTVVTHPLNYDFFLCSHFGLQGTSRPCHYTVIQDDNEFSADDLQKLTYYLCHTYVRCTKSISSPSPVMYAHLAAYRARQHLLTQGEESSGASTTSSVEFHPLPAEIANAIRVVADLNDKMYYV